MKLFYNKRITILCAIIVIVGLMISCSKQSNTLMPATSTCDPNISFINTVKPILDKDCNTAGCHDDKVITALNMYQTVHDGAAQIRLSISTGKMPKNGTISIADKNAIFCWIDNGAKNN